MEKIDIFYLPRLHNGENVNFHYESLEQLEKANPSELGVEEQTRAYRSACGNLKQSVDVFESSELSVESTRLDTRRDHAYSGFKSYVKVYLNDEDEPKSEAAERIIAVIRNTERELGNPLLLGLAKESTALSSLSRNLAPLAADIELIGAAGRLEKLETANQEYIDLQFERYLEQSNKPSGDVKAARVAADAAYRDIVDRINAQILLNGDEKFVAYAKAQNALIERYNRIVAQRRGRSGKKEAATGGAG
jgi:hypothetical protein